MYRSIAPRRSIARMRREIRDLHKRLGLTMIYVTHDQVEAMTMADIWVERHLFNVVSVSQALGEALSKAKLNGLGFYPVKQV